MQKLQHSLVSWFGFSGSPLFLPNGHVVGLHNSTRTITQKGSQVELAYGVRVDCLWELLVFHHLDNKGPIAADKSKLLLQRYNQPDPAIDKYNAAAKLVNEVDHLLLEKKYSEGIDKCSAAINICPGYSKAYFTRAVMLSAYHFNRFSVSTRSGESVNEEQLKLAKLAQEDAHTYLTMNPNDPEAILLFCLKSSDVDVNPFTSPPSLPPMPNSAISTTPSNTPRRPPSLPRAIKTIFLPNSSLMRTSNPIANQRSDRPTARSGLCVSNWAALFIPFRFF
jgi:hypothetical protein